MPADPRLAGDLAPDRRADLAGTHTWEESDWRMQAQVHAEQVHLLTQHRLYRRAQGRSHPVDDFLFEYYRVRPAQLARWHPGLRQRLRGAAERADWSGYRWDGDSAWVPQDAFLRRRGSAVDFVRALLTATLSRPARLGCFGLHEWAMVYQAEEKQIRHQGWPLRLGREGTDDVVRNSRIACSHFDAYRFFTAGAQPLNLLRPERDSQVAMEQPGCLHAGMDLYKWCTKLSPSVPSELTLRAFLLARQIRELDMRASPYDLSELGYAPVPIETPEGRTEYANAQREFSERTNALRRDLLAALQPLADLQSSAS